MLGTAVSSSTSSAEAPHECNAEEPNYDDKIEWDREEAEHFRQDKKEVLNCVSCPIWIISGHPAPFSGCVRGCYCPADKCVMSTVATGRGRHVTEICLERGI